MSFDDEKAIAKRHGIHYYFPDPLEVKDLLEWILTERKLHKYDVDKLCNRLDEDIRMNNFHDREQVVHVEDRHFRELSSGYAHKLEDAKAEEVPIYKGFDGGFSILETIFNFFIPNSKSIK